MQIDTCITYWMLTPILKLCKMTVNKVSARLYRMEQYVWNIADFGTVFKPLHVSTCYSVVFVFDDGIFITFFILLLLVYGASQHDGQCKCVVNF